MTTLYRVRCVLLGLATAVLTAGMLAIPSAATAQPRPHPHLQQPQPPGQPSQQAPQELAPVMLILDASGSMTGPDPSGQTKMAAAKAAIGQLTQQLPPTAQLGLTVYGTSTGNSEAERAAGCQDVTVLHPVGTLDPAGIAQAAQAIQPSGYTPIGRSLQVASDALPAEGPRAIVLVSDGIDTCAPPDPCQIARQLAQQGVKLRVHVVGFDVDAAARNQLTCIADATGGTYTDATNADELGPALDQATQSALRTFQPTGTPITGSIDPATAPTIQPGAYLDQLDLDRERFYAIDVPAGTTAYVTGTMVPQDVRSILESAVGLRGRVYTADGGRICDRFGINSGRPGDPIVVVGDSWTVTPDTTDTPNACKRPGRYLIGFTRGVGDDRSVPLELLIGLEPPLQGDPGPPPGQPVTFTPPTATPEPVTGGGSFTTAATLPGSGSFTDTIRGGEFVFYRVHLDWGQGLAWRLRIPGGQGDRPRTISTHMYLPTRQQLGTAQATGYHGQTIQHPNDAEAFATRPVRYRNRQQETFLPTASLPGWYYLVVSATRTTGITLDLTVAGNPEPGPQYAGTTAEDDLFGGDNPATTDPQPRPTTPSSGGQASNQDPATSPDTYPDPLNLASSSSPLLWAGAAALVLLLIAAVLGFTLGRRTQRR